MKVERRDNVRLPDPLPNCSTGGGSVIQAKPFTLDKWEVYRAWEQVKANAGAAGIDGQTISDFELNLKDNLYKLWNRLSSGSYHPPAVKGVAIPKQSGGERLLGFPQWLTVWRKRWFVIALNRWLNPTFYRTLMVIVPVSRHWMRWL